MFGIDEALAHQLNGATVFLVIAVAFLLGLRHASDPDHLVAISTVIASDRETGSKRAARLGIAWGVGHGTTLAVLGLPIVLFNAYLPEVVQRGAETFIGCLIIFLALRLLLRWKRREIHLHSHTHDGQSEHVHLHDHSLTGVSHEHKHNPAAFLGRTTKQALGIGMAHGMAGSAGVGVLLIAAIPDQTEGVIALIVFAFGTAFSMAMASWLFGMALTHGPQLRRFSTFNAGVAVFSLLFGVWYVLAGLSAVPYFS